ncbi:MAG: hypothetical protein V3T23_13805 [Nitrososphaerales archaeon]
MADAYLALISPIASGGVAHFSETRVPFTSGKLWSWRTDQVEKAFIDWEGSFSGHDGLFGGKVTITETLAVGTPETWAVINVSIDRVYNANMTNVNEMKDVLGTLILDLIATGLLDS